MTPEQQQNHIQWLQKLGIDADDLIHHSDTYHLEMYFWEAHVLYEKHEGVIDAEAAEAFLGMSNLISDAMKKYDPQHRAVVVANVSGLKSVTRHARHLLLKDLEDWDPMRGISFSGADWLVRAIGYAIARRLKNIRVTFHKNDEEALDAAKKLNQESGRIAPTTPREFGALPTDSSTFSELWQSNPRTIKIGNQKLRILQQPHWEYSSPKSTGKVTYSVIENRILLAESSGSITGSDAEIFYPIQDRVAAELGRRHFSLIMDTRKVTWSDAASRRAGEKYYIENQDKYTNVVLLASRFVRFIARSLTLVTRHNFDNWHLATDLEEAYEILQGELVKELAMYEEVAQDAPHPVLSELNQIVLEQRDIIRQYHDHMDLLIQNITRSAWGNILRPAPMTFEKSDLFSDVYAAVELMQKDYLELVADSERAREEAQEANRLKNLFLARMSHDLRTPLNSIMGFTDLLLTEDMEQKHKEKINLIEDSAEYLKGIINDLLEISTIEAGATRIQMQDFDFHQLIHQLAQSQQQTIAQKRLSLSVDVGSQTPKIICSDKGRLQQILLNLVTNAVKYTDEGEINITTDAVEESEAHWCVTVAIRDTGCGIPEHMHEKVFDAFRQVEESAVHPVEGKGLGLAICRELVNGLGGTIALQSQVGKGSTFTVTFRTPRLSKTAVAQPVASVDLLEGHVLLVEDNSINQQVLNKLMEKIGVRVTTVDNGNEAIHLLRSDPAAFDLILMDCQLPQLNGWETTQIIREDLKLKMPILALTAFAQQEDKRRSQEAGMDGFLAKPVRLATLHQILSDYLPKQTS